MIKPVLASRRSIGFMGTAAKPAASGWWLSGGISASNCVAAYQPKGAASLAASYTNLASPGMYNAAPGVAPTWDATSGWKFSAASSQYLTSNVKNYSQSWSVFVRFSDVTNNASLYGCQRSSVYTFVHINQSIGLQYGAITYTSRILPVITSGVCGTSGRSCYRNGNVDATVGSNADYITNAIFIGARGDGVNNPMEFLSGNIQSLAIYNVTISAAQVSALTTAMNAL